MLQTPYINPVMDKNACVDRQGSIRKLGFKKALAMELTTRPDSDIDRSITVSIGTIPTVFTLEGSTIPFSFVSTSTTCLRGISRVNRTNHNVILPSNGFECHSERCIRHTFSLTITPLTPLSFVKMFQIFDGYKGVELFSDINNFVSNLIASGFGIIGFVFSQSTKGLFSIPIPLISIGFEFGTSDRYIPLLMSYIPTEVELSENLTFTVDNGYRSKSLYSHIDTENGIILIGDSKVLLDGNEEVRPVKLKIGGSPSFVRMTDKSIISTIHFDGDNDSTIHSNEGDDWVTVVGSGEFTATWDIKWDRYSSDSTAVIEYSNSVFEEFHNGLGVQFIFFTNSFIELCMDVISTHTLITMVNNICKSRLINIDKNFDFLSFCFCGFEDIEFNRFCDFHSNTNNDLRIFKGLPQFLPSPSEEVSLRCFPL